jgi:hypothetical protein
MSRVFFTGVVMVALVACKGDSGPTSPGSSASLADGSVIAGARSDNGFDDRGKPHSSNVEALVTFTHIRGHARNCNGEDGFYGENHPTYTGTVTGDPRLTGVIELSATELVFFGGDEFHAPSYGSAVIRDAATGRTKVEVAYNAWGHNDALQGTLVGHVSDGKGSNLIANLRYVFGDNGSVGIQIGGMAQDNRMTAGIWGGKCTGKFTEYDSDIPVPGAATTAAIRGFRMGPSVWRSPTH